MTSMIDTNSNTNTIDLRALLESGESTDHIPKAFKQMHSYIKKLEKENKKLKRDIDGDGMLYEGYKKELSNKCKMLNRMCKDIVKLKKENEQLKEQEYKHSSIYVGQLNNNIIRLKEENEELQSNLDEMNYQYKCLLEGEEGY